MRTPEVLEKRHEEHRHWLERFLFRCCELFHHSAPEKEARRLAFSRPAFLAYRSWARYQPTARSQPYLPADITPAQHRSVWKSYYDLASQTLQEERPYVPLDGPSEGLIPGSKEQRRAQTGELRRIESVYESVLLGDVPFPNAESANLEVDRWTDQVVANWRVIISPEWSDDDIGDEGGKEAYGRRVLEVRSFPGRMV